MKNKEKLRKMEKAYYELNKQKILEYHKLHPPTPEVRKLQRERETKTSRAEYTREYWKKNKEKKEKYVLATAESDFGRYQKEYYEKKKEEILHYSSLYYLRHKDKFEKYQDQFAQKTKETFLEGLKRFPNLKVRVHTFVLWSPLEWSRRSYGYPEEGELV